MRRALVLGIVLTACLAATAVERPTHDPDKEKAEGFVTLFDGKSMDGWVRYAHDGKVVPPERSAFRVDGNTIFCSGKGDDYWIATREKYADCVLRLEYKLAKGTNSGVFFRAPPARPAYKGFEVQIIDDVGQDPTKHSTGAIYDVLTPMRNLSNPVGDWNEMEITVKGSTVVVTVNGFKVIDTDFRHLTEPIGKFDFPYAKMPATGHVGVQNHGGEIWFRNLRLKPLK